MQVRNLKIEPDPRGGRIHLSWINPDFPNFGGVKILRRELTFPGIEDIGTEAELRDEPASSTPAGDPVTFSDVDLKGETVYYYATIVYDDSNPTPNFQTPSLATAMATISYQSAEHLYSNLPAIYRRYDISKPPETPSLDSGDKDKGQLRRLVEMFGLQFDLMRSFASGTRNFSDIRRIDGNLLPLLADWIGWGHDFTLPLPKQRNQIDYAPHYYRTTGIAANLRAQINRITNWDAEIKEFAHNLLRSNNPEALMISEMVRRSGIWEQFAPVTLDVAYGGKPAVIPDSESRFLLFYHTKQSIPVSRSDESEQIEGAGSIHIPNDSVSANDRWHIWYKMYDRDEWLPSRRITHSGDINKHPEALRDNDGNLWMFWNSYEEVGGRNIPQIGLKILSVGYPARPARIEGSLSGPFSFTDGDLFRITIDYGTTSIDRVVIFRSEQFHNTAQATPDEVVGLLESEIPGVKVNKTDDGEIVLTSIESGASSVITLSPSNVATQLGFVPGTYGGSDATRAQLLGAQSEPFSLDGTELVIEVGQGVEKVIAFRGEASASEVASTINLVLPGTAEVDSGRIKLSSTVEGSGSFISVSVESSTAASLLGFGSSLSAEPLPADDAEPAAIVDSTGDLWLFWSSRRGAETWDIWYNRLDRSSGSWGVAKQLTGEISSDREPSIVFDSTAGRLWVFWSRKKENGLWNIFYRITTNLDFDAITNADWTEDEVEPVPTNYDNKEPFPTLIAGGEVELFFSSNRADGWNVWSKPLTPVLQGTDTQITFGEFTARAPAAIQVSDQTTRVWFRSNETQIYESSLYPTAKTFDSRYSGSTTLDTRNPAKIGLRKHTRDIQHYTYDTLKSDSNWYARDTIGVYLTPDTDDQELIIRDQNLIRNVLARFLPIQVRPVFIIQQAYNEFIYSYDHPEIEPELHIGEQMIDSILSEVYSGLDDSYVDSANFLFLKTWEAGERLGILPDLNTDPPDLSFRLFLTGVEEGDS